MKTIWIVPALFLSVAVAMSQGPVPIQSSANSALGLTSWEIVARDANSRVWENKGYSRNEITNQISPVPQYTELATGLHYWKEGQWIESKEEIDILPTGGAAAIQGQHRVYFPADIYDGVIELFTPDGKHLKSRSLGISYDDGNKTVMIANLKHSLGLILPTGNQVIYTNAFTDFAADLIYTYRRDGFECDLVFREKLPLPESLGLNPINSRLELLTEFFDPPEPEQTTRKTATFPPANGSRSFISGQNLDLVDTTLKFGGMTMIQGKAFLVNENTDSFQKQNSQQNSFVQRSTDDSNPISVMKTWLHVDGRTFLIEGVSAQKMNSKFRALPNPTSLAATADQFLYKVSTVRLLPSRRPVKVVDTNSLHFATADFNENRSVVLDYNIVNSDQSDFTFQGDKTYYVSGPFTITGIATIEGGAVIKFGAPITCTGPVMCLTDDYRPTIFTSTNDNVVGDPIIGSAGTPNIGGDCLHLYPSDFQITVLKNIRFCFSGRAVDSFNPITIQNCQFVSCPVSISTADSLTLQNVLFDKNVTFPVIVTDGLNVSAENVTSDATNFCSIIEDQLSAWEATETVFHLNLTNSIFCLKGTGYVAGCYDCSGAYPTNVIQISSNSVAVATNGFLFQTAGAGNYYLAAYSSYRNAGTTNINPALLAALRKKTTYPPILYSNYTVSANTTLQPQAQRDYDVPDLGYHYDPIDYLVDSFWVTNATLTITNGTVVGAYYDSGVLITDGSSIVSIGTPEQPNWITRYSAVQEQPIVLGSFGLSLTEPVNPYHTTATAPTGLFRFTKFSCPAGTGYHLYHNQSNWAYSNLLVEDCEFWGGQNDFSGYNNSTAVFKNNLFVRTANAGFANGYSSDSLSVSNNLFWGGSVFVRAFGNSNSWYFFNNAFDHSSNTVTGAQPQNTVNGYNAYIGDTNLTKRLVPSGSTDILLSSLAYQSGPLGDYYQPTNSALINTGSVTANLNSLYHFTTTTNQWKETNSVVDIGYHYVAWDYNGYPIDSDGDGIPDYLEDSNGNGSVNSGETDWQSATDLGLRVLITRPRHNSILP